MDSFRAAVRVALGDEIITEPMPEDESKPSPALPPDLPIEDDYFLYTVKATDTLWAIARDRLGSGTRYKEIMSLNGLSSDRIRKGQLLKLPE